MLVARAQSRLNAQLYVRQWLDLKALGLLGADAAAAGVLIAVHDAVNRFWRLDAAGLALAGLLLVVAVWPRTLDGGPSLREFYETFGSAAAVDVGRQMLAELLEAIETNDRVIRAHKPEMLIELSLVLIVLSVVGAFPWLSSAKVRRWRRDTKTTSAKRSIRRRRSRPAGSFRSPPFRTCTSGPASPSASPSKSGCRPRGNPPRLLSS